jgi:ABC-type proline/glycine betaine transport system ATPase subunit
VGPQERSTNGLRQGCMSIVIQSIALMPHMSVFANVEFGLMLCGDKPPTPSRREEEVPEMAGLGERKKPSSLERPRAWNPLDDSRDTVVSPKLNFQLLEGL